MKLIKEDNIELMKSGEFVPYNLEIVPLDAEQLSLNAIDDLGVSLRLAISTAREELRAFAKRLPADIRATLPEHIIEDR